MKFLLKVLALVFLVVMSKLAKDDTMALQKPVVKEASSTPVLTSNAQQTSLTERPNSEVTVKFVKGSLQIN